MSKRWEQWLKQFHWYATASNLYNKSSQKQIATFMTVIGEDALTIYDSFTIEVEPDSLQTIIDKFNSYFIKKTNVIYERFIFNNLSQENGEPFNDFLTRLTNQANKCSYEVMKDFLIRDRIVCGINSKVTREKLLNMEDLTLDKSIHICRSEELIKSQLTQMSEKIGNKVDVVRAQYTGQEKQTEDNFDCGRCGTRHGRRSCPAFQKKCSSCGLKGHFSKVCRSGKEPKKGRRTILSTENFNTQHDQVDSLEQSSDQVLFMSSINDSSESNDYSWNEFITLPLNNKVSFKLDTGAQCNVINEDTAKKSKLAVSKSNVNYLVSYTNNKITVLGECFAKVITGRKEEHIVKFIVVGNNYPAILGRDSCVQLGYIKRVDKLNSTDFDDNIFNGVGCLKNYEYDIDLVDNPSLKIYPARRVPYAIRDQVKQELDSMVKLGVIKPVTEPTPSVSPMVVVRQKDKIRICLDPSDLNKNIKRRHHPLQTIEEISAHLNGSKFFSLLDCKKGFWQIKVTERSSKYLTFSTPWGRYSYLRMPFGIASAPEVFQERMSSTLAGLEGVHVSMDDVLIHGPTREITESRTKKAIDVLSAAGLKLNKDKCVFVTPEIKFLGHLVTEKGLLPDPSKLDAIKKLKKPSNVAELHRFLGMITYLGKFIPNLSNISTPLRKLISKEVAWVWDCEQENSFQHLKELLSTPPLLRYYNPHLPITLSVDASSNAVGAVLMQEGLPVAYSSKALTKTQQNYSQLEKEALAISTACQKFHEYIWGSVNLIIETDHKPLESIFKKALHDTPPRLRRIIMEVIPYQPRIVYKRGKYLYIADTLSRDCNNEPSDDDGQLPFSVDLVVVMSKERFQEAQRYTNEDDELTLLRETILKGWPEEKTLLPEELHKYWAYRDELATHENLIFKGQRLYMPSKLRSLTLKHIHLGHRGIEASLNIARDHVFWPGLSHDIRNYVSKCTVCNKLQKDNQEEKLLSQASPSRPWTEVGTDIFHLSGKDYLIIADSYSGFFDFIEIKSTNSSTIITELKKWFAVHGIPDTLLSDGGTQYNSQEFKRFEQEWQFNQRISSPLFSRSNGLAERYVQEAKLLLKKCTDEKSDPYLALLHQRNVPRGSLGSPAQRLMSRRTKTLLPTTSELLQPSVVKDVPAKLQELRNKSKYYCDRNKRSCVEFNEGERILLRNEHRNWQPATVVGKGPQPRSYIVKTQDGTTYRRNSWFIKKCNTSADGNTISSPNLQLNNSRTDFPTIRKSQRTSRKPNRLDI